MSGRQAKDLQLILNELKDVVRGLVAGRKGSYKNDPDYRWAAALWHREESRGVLVELARRDADVGALLMTGILFRFEKAYFQDAISQVRYGPVPCPNTRFVDYEDLLADAEALEETSGGPADMPHLPPDYRELCESLRAANEALGDGGGKFVPESIHALCLPPSEVESVGKAVRPSGIPGPSGDTAVNVLAILVAGHLNAVSGKRRATLAARFIVDVMQLGSREAPATDHERAFRRRIEHYFGRHEDMTRRVRLLSEKLGLPVRLA